MDVVYLYGSIDPTSAEKFARELREKKNGVEIRLETNGGRTPSGSSILTAIVEYKGRKHMSVDGDVLSMGAFFLLYADHVKMSNTAEIMFHKAAFSKGYELIASDEEKANIIRDNERYKAKMAERIGGTDAGKKLIETVFEEGKRNNVYITAKEAKEIGLIDEIIEITPEQKAAFQKEFYKMALAEPKESTKENSNLKPNTMEITQKDLEAAKIQGRKEALEEISGWLPFMDVDKEACVAGIKSGKSISEEARSEFLIKVASKNMLKEAQETSTPAVGAEGGNKTPQETPEKKAEREEKEAFIKKIMEA